MVGSTAARTATARTWSGALDERDLVADCDLAALGHPREHAALALELRTKAVAQLVHPVARVADHRDLELGLAGHDALADRPLLDIVAFDRDVLADRARLDVDRLEVLLGDEQHFALGRVRVRAAFEALTLERPDSLMTLGTA